MFRSTRKMGGPDFGKLYEEKLTKEMDEAFENFLKHNESKNIFNTARTPFVLVIMVIASYIGAGVFALVGLNPVAALFTLVMWFALCLIIVAGYVHYTGEYVNIGQMIDDVAEAVWANIIEQALALLAAYGAKRAIQAASTNKKSN